MTALIYTDPHLGLRRQANTTNGSQARWRERMHSIVRETLEHHALPAVCAGDLFDTYGNDEATIRQGIDIVRRTEWLIAGNHDVSQVAGKVGSLELIQELEPERILRANFGDYGFDSRGVGGVRFYGVPHVVVQDLFDESLDDVQDDAATGNSGEVKVLLLHCNYDSGYAEEDDTSLNLPRKRARRLLETFDYVVLGHEHNAREDFDGRLIVLGNTFPAGFADISDKRVMTVDDSGDVAFHTIWRMAEGYAEFTADALPEATQAEFVRVTGTVKASQVGEVSRQAARLWRTSPNLLALKLAVEMEGGAGVDGEAAGQQAVERLPDLVSRELEGTEMWDLWKEIVDDHHSQAA
jgi:DNA repair exonuclease SbcCD nuclease subunit